MAVSGNLARGRKPLSGAFAGDMRLVAMLDDSAEWPDRTGLYCPVSTGDRILHDRRRIQLAPMTDERDELNGLYLSLMGLRFDLLLTPPAPHEAPHRHAGNFRPGSILVEDHRGTSRILLSWEDGKHHGSLTMKFNGDVSEAQPSGGSCRSAVLRNCGINSPDRQAAA